MVEEIKDRVYRKLEELKSQARADDPVVNFLDKDPISDFQFKSELRMLPFAVVEQYGSIILQDEKEYQKHYDPKHDVFLQEWEKQYESYWMDRLQLIEYYLNPRENNLSPFEEFNRLSDQMIKIEKRSLLLKPDPKTVEEKQTRLNGSEKDYKFIRSYWIDEKGEKKRMIARHIGYRYLQIEKEIGDLFHDRGFACTQGVSFSEREPVRYDDREKWDENRS